MMAALSCLGAWRGGGREREIERGSERFGEGGWGSGGVSVCVSEKQITNCQKNHTQCGYKATDQHWTMRL